MQCMYVNVVEQKTEQKANITPIVFFEVDGWSKFKLKIPASHNTRENLWKLQMGDKVNVKLQNFVLLFTLKSQSCWMHSKKRKRGISSILHFFFSA